jgi:hypothetical protein
LFRRTVKKQILALIDLVESKAENKNIKVKQGSASF